ncbi:KAP family P-loop NTPase fold protein [Ulvibacterium marinum]|uniref:KAP family P-loop NTPase fold protein n=1 Tax=Ulvibacterium marinum TaxID=2419782 RepID=UPI002494AD9B|nr:P-loop NTPase fold protein [Ulvibacterium marinum]
MWNDNETNLDFIDYQHFVNAVTSILDNNDLLPCSIGIFGDWGSGKSSLMKMVEENYLEEGNILTINFNGWLFEGYEDTKTVLMGRIVDEIIKKRKPQDKALKIAAKLLRKIDLLKIGQSAVKHGAGFMLMGPAGLALTTTSDVLSKLSNANYEDYIKKQNENTDPDEVLKNDIQEFHLAFEELIQETKIDKIIVFIDDLDRCSPDTVIGTLEAIKLFLFAKKTAFIIGADERLIKHAVRRRFPEIPGDNTEVGRDYLEKLIQYPIRIPPLSNLELTTYINLLFTNLYTDKGEFEHIRLSVLEQKSRDQFGFTYKLENANEFVTDVNQNLKEALLLSAQLVSVLAVGLNGNPRQTKRFLNTLLLRHQMANSKGEILDKRILAKLMLLEYFKSETFKSLYQQQAKNQGVITELKVMEELVTKDDDEKFDDLPVEYQSYLQDSWIRKWLFSKPNLADINLQSYFYYSRDKLSVSGTNIQRMSSQAQDLYAKILNNSETIQGLAFKETGTLSDGDASAIFESLSERMKNEGVQDGESPTIKRLIDFCDVRKELISQLLSLVDKLPHQVLPLSITTWLQGISENTSHEPTVNKMIKDWSTSTTNKRLAGIAKRKLKSIS